MATVAPPVAGLVARPRLFALLDAAARVTLVCAPAGSGKTMLVSSWLGTADGDVAWVGVEREEADASRFWGVVMDAVRGTEAIPPGDPLATLVPAPLGGQDEFVERLIDGLTATTTAASTVLGGQLDEAALHGVLARIEAFGLELLDVRRI